MPRSIVWRLASPTQDSMKHPEMHKKVKVRKKILKVKKIYIYWGEKNFDFFFLSKKMQVAKIARAGQKLCGGGG